MRYDGSKFWNSPIAGGVIPPGKYHVVVTSVTDDVTRESKNPFSRVGYKVLAPLEHAGRMVFDSYYSISQKDFSMHRMTNAAQAMGLEKVFDSKQFLNRRLVIDVVIQKEESGRERNSIVSFSPYVSRAVSVPAPPPAPKPAPAPPEKAPPPAEKPQEATAPPAPEERPAPALPGLPPEEPSLEEAIRAEAEASGIEEGDPW
jgi:hypothetical protein